MGGGASDPTTAPLPTHCLQDQTSGPLGRLSSVTGHTWTQATSLSGSTHQFPCASNPKQLQRAKATPDHQASVGFSFLFPSKRGGLEIF